MAGRQCLSLPHHRAVQQFLGSGATEPDAARSFFVVSMGEGPRRATILDSAYRTRTLGGTFRIGVLYHHPEVVGAVLLCSIRDFRPHPHRRKQQKRLGRLAGALFDCDRVSANSRSPHADELASTVVWCGTDPESPKKILPSRRIERSRPGIKTPRRKPCIDSHRPTG